MYIVYLAVYHLEFNSDHNSRTDSSMNGIVYVFRYVIFETWRQRAFFTRDFAQLLISRKMTFSDFLYNSILHFIK